MAQAVNANVLDPGHRRNAHERLARVIQRLVAVAAWKHLARCATARLCREHRLGVIVQRHIAPPPRLGHGQTPCAALQVNVRPFGRQQQQLQCGNCRLVGLGLHCLEDARDLI